MLGRPEGMTAVYVTHDQAEAFAIADKLVVLNNGRVEQIGAPQTIYRQPATPFVARFLGMTNIFEAKLVSHDPSVLEIGDWRLEIAPAGVNNSQFTIHNSQFALIRPEAARLVADGDEAVNVVNGRLTEHSFRGRYQLITVETSHQPPLKLKFELETAVTLPPVGEKVQLSLEPGAIVPLESG